MLARREGVGERESDWREEGGGRGESLTGERTVRSLAHCWALDFSETAMLKGE